MLKEYPKFEKGQVETIFSDLSKKEQELINDYLDYRKSRGLSERSLKDLRRYIIQIRHIIGCNFNKLNTHKDLVRLSNIVKDAYLSNEVKKNLRINLTNLFKYLYEDWNTRFKGLECLANKKLKGNGSDIGIISDKDLPSDEEFEAMLKSEQTIFWKTFLLTQEITGLRTIEVRTIENDKINFNGDGTATIEIFMTKTGNTKYVFTNKQTTDFIKKLQEEHKNKNTYGKYLFCSPINYNNPISKNSVNKWFNKLSQKATGRIIKPYWLRHKKATLLYGLSDSNVISENTAIKTLGHSRSMKERYVHRPKEQEIEILKKQVFKTEISQEEKNKLEKLEKEISRLKEFILIITQEISGSLEKGKPTPNFQQIINKLKQ